MNNNVSEIAQSLGQRIRVETGSIVGVDEGTVTVDLEIADNPSNAYNTCAYEVASTLVHNDVTAEMDVELTDTESYGDTLKTLTVTIEEKQE